MIIIFNLWCKFDTGSLTTNDGTDTITLTNNGTATNAGVSVRGNNSLSLNGTNQWLSGTINGIANNSFSFSVWIYPKTGAINTSIICHLGNVNQTDSIIFFAFNKEVANLLTADLFLCSTIELSLTSD